MQRPPLTTSGAAALAAVAPSTIKRWADQGLLPFERTPGGHRRFDRAVVEHFLRAHGGATRGNGGVPPVDDWIRCLTAGGPRPEIDRLLHEARSRLGTWAGVADELGIMLDDLGQQWADCRLSIADEHIASNTLARALARTGDALPVPLSGRRCLLAMAGTDEHTLGLSLADLVLREAGWSPLWLGRRAPIGEIVHLIESGWLTMVGLSASVASNDRRALGRIAGRVGSVCQEHSVALVLGGRGAWPASPLHGTRHTSFAGFREQLERAS